MQIATMGVRERFSTVKSIILICLKYGEWKEIENHLYLFGDAYRYFGTKNYNKHISDENLIGINKKVQGAKMCNFSNRG